VFTAAVEPGDVLDWRTDPDVVASFRPFDLPAGLERRILALMDELQLDYGTVDLIQTPDDRWVFLEVNSISFFDHVERAAGLPIADAVADLLTGALPSRFADRNARRAAR
jgi:glutathione synthase/RimK-type ligase-like ATP-grasp enzyme